MMNSEVTGGNAEGEAAGHTAPKPHRSRSDILWGTTMIAAAGLGTLGVSVGYYMALTEEPKRTWLGKITPDGAQEVFVVNHPVETKCQDINKYLSSTLSNYAA